MSRPQKCRHVLGLPGVAFFKPAGIPRTDLEEIALTVDEYEAIRLADMEGVQHGAAAQRMGISRPTFTRILGKAHQKVATALVQGKMLRIEGGNYQVSDTTCERLTSNEKRE